MDSTISDAELKQLLGQLYLDNYAKARHILRLEKLLAEKENGASKTNPND